MGEWENVPDDIDEYVGFIYRITNLLDGRKYIGKKQFWTTTKVRPTKYKMKDGKYVKDKHGKRILNKRKTKKHIKVESDWRTYCGSCNELLQDIEKHGLINFKREIIACYKNKFDLAYAEAKLQFDLEVLFRREYYNGIINIRLKKKVKE